MAAISAPTTTPVRSLARNADHPRFLESVVGRMLELLVFSVEGIRERVQRTTVH